MRLGLVAVVLALGGCGSATEAPAQVTAPVRIARLAVDQTGVNASASDEPLAVRLRIWADGVAAGDFQYRGMPDPFAELGQVTAEAKHWRVVADYRDGSGQHSVEREAQSSSGSPLESLLLCLYEDDGAPGDSALVLIGQPVNGSAPAASDPLPAPLQAIGFDVPHTDFDWTGGPYGAELHDRIHWGAEEWADARATKLLEPGLYHLELRTPRAALIGAGVVQLEQYVTADDFAIER